MLEPDEQFTVNSLSGGKPKRPDQIKSLALSLGPDFMTDIIEVETMDHARLRLQLSYNWHFSIEYERFAESKERDEQAQLLFNVRDFVGDACKAIASRVRSSVASVAFDDFHRSSARLIRVAVFGEDPKTGKIRDEFVFVENKLTITNIDIQNVEPVDERTRESLMKSVQLAIEITTRKQERNARHAAQQIEQEAQGKIARQRISNQATAEEARQELIKLQAECAALASTGTAKAEAEAKAEYLEIEGAADVEKARLQAEASEIEARAELREIEAEQKAQVEHSGELSGLALRKQQRTAEIEAEKFKSLVTAIQPSTIRAIAQAGPEMQARLLKALGLKGYLLTDGNSPVNLFNAAKGMVGDNVGNHLPLAAV
jgi:major vault protein